ncbi:MAG: arylsulfatase, partial [Verrucomicrobiota bacterium]|nr:arylsulfatase [Verrucomicrobiota bacterium]
KKKASSQWELYDLLADPFEEKNLAKQHPEVVERMDKDFSVWAESAETDQQKVIEKYYRKK